MRFLSLLFALCLVSCAGSRDVAVTRLHAPRVEVADYTTGESAICEIHHTQMERAVVPIAYGLMPLPDARMQARYAASTNSFPHAETYALGGCVVSDNSPIKAVIYRCPQCKKAAAEWDSVYDKH
jgi:hypothetical protein